MATGILLFSTGLFGLSGPVDQIDRPVPADTYNPAVSGPITDNTTAEGGSTLTGGSISLLSASDMALSDAGVASLLPGRDRAILQARSDNISGDGLSSCWAITYAANGSCLVVSINETRVSVISEYVSPAPTQGIPVRPVLDSTAILDIVNASMAENNVRLSGHPLSLCYIAENCSSIYVLTYPQTGDNSPGFSVIVDPSTGEVISFDVAPPVSGYEIMAPYSEGGVVYEGSS